MYGQQKNWMVSRVTRRVCEKNRPKVAQPNFWPDLMHNIYRRKICPNFFLLHPSFSKELPKVNNRPIGEHSPNLVALMTSLEEFQPAATKKCPRLFLNGR
jgi:hypothetical protein